MRRPAEKKTSRGASLLKSLTATLRREVDAQHGAQWPAVKWQTDPVGFVREVLGGEPLPHQEELLRAVAQSQASVAVRSGQKTGKTKTVIWLALWFYCSFPDAQVHMTATQKEQVDKVLWTELGKTIRAARAKGFEIETPAVNPGTGLRSQDGSRLLRGFTVRDVEAVSGLSGQTFFIVDEASSMTERIWQGIEGNRISGSRVILISNPSRTEGPFFDIFHKEAQRKAWHTFHFDSEEVAAYCAVNNLRIPGVANLETIERWAELYNRDSVFFKMRVKGNFILDETGKVIGFGLITAAQEAWDDADESGPLSLGIDPAGPGSGGDEWAFAIVRGKKLLALFTFRGLSEDSALEHVRGFLKTYRQGDEIPRVIVDSEGSIGSSFYGRLRAIEANLARKRPELSFECFGVKSSHNARRHPTLYDKVRDELWANLAAWMKGGGGILKDHELERQLNAVNWLGTNGEKLKATPKEGPGGLREKLGRSPDHADALCLAVWDPKSWGVHREDTASEGAAEEDEAWGAKPVAARGAEAGNPFDAVSPEAGYDPYNSGWR